jgi:hypothetical protein
MTNIIRAWGVKPFVFTLLLLITNSIAAQDELRQSKRVYVVKPPMQITNTVGGSYIDSYVLNLKQGQKLQVQVENKTRYSKVYFDVVLAGTETRFGSDSSENSWSGIAPQNGDYEIRIVAYPTAEYTLLVDLISAGEDERNPAVEPAVKMGRRAAYSYAAHRDSKTRRH